MFANPFLPAFFCVLKASNSKGNTSRFGCEVGDPSNGIRSRFVEAQRMAPAAVAPTRCIPDRWSATLLTPEDGVDCLQSFATAHLAHATAKDFRAVIPWTTFSVSSIFQSKRRGRGSSPPQLGPPPAHLWQTGQAAPQPLRTADEVFGPPVLAALRRRGEELRPKPGSHQL